MRSIFVRGVMLASLLSSNANSNNVDGSYFCLNKRNQLSAEFEIRNTRDQQSYTACCDESGCLEEDPAGRCLSTDGQKSDGFIKFYSDILPSNLGAEFTLRSGYDRFFRPLLYASGNLGSIINIVFYMRGAYADSNSPNSRFDHWLIIEDRTSGKYTKSDCMRKNMAKDMKYAYKIFTLSQWMTFQETGEFVGSPDDVRDGFIHLATNEQVDAIIKKYFSNEKLVYVGEFLTADLGENLRWELTPSDSYPHLYRSPLKVGWIKNFQVIKPSKP